MFSGEYQGGSFVDLMPSGSNPLAGWKVTGAQKVYDKDTKGYIHQSCGGGATRMQIPKDDKATLGLLQPFLVLQVNLPRVRFGSASHGGMHAWRDACTTTKGSSDHLRIHSFSCGICMWIFTVLRFCHVLSLTEPGSHTRARHI